QVLPAAVGQLVLKEVDSLKRATEDPQRPYAVVLGGSKVSDKLGVIANLLEKADRLLIGGGMVFTFLAAQGHSVGKSLLEEDQVETVRATSPRPLSAAPRSSCPPTSSLRTRSPPTPRTTSCPQTRSPTLVWAWTSAPSRPSSSRASSR